MRGVVVFLLTLLLLSRGAGAQTPAQERLFESLRRELTDVLQATGRFSSIVAAGKTALKARSLDGRELALNIESLAADVTAKPTQRKDFVAMFVRAVLAQVEPAKRVATKDEFVASLRLIVRSKDYLSSLREQKSGALWRPLAGTAVIMIAIDGGERLQIADAGHGAAHGLTDDAVFDLAREQLKRFVADIETEDALGVRALSLPDAAYSPSLLLLDEPWAKVEKDFGAGFVVAVPDRSTLLMAAARNAGQLRTAVELVAKSRKTAPMISELLQRSGSGWIVFSGR